MKKDFRVQSFNWDGADNQPRYWKKLLSGRKENYRCIDRIRETVSK